MCINPISDKVKHVNRDEREVKGREKESQPEHKLNLILIYG